MLRLTMYSVFVVLVILVVILAYIYRDAIRRIILRRKKHLPCLTSDAKDVFVRYVTGNHAARDYEEERSGIADIANHSEQFFDYELREKEHSDVARSVRGNGGLMTAKDVQQWVAESTAEVANRNGA
jgi:hypothetical protein